MPSSDVLNSSAYRSTSGSFVAGVSGVAALDTPQTAQTKAEIRHIVAEIAELSASRCPQSEFLSAALPRICQAMGASAAALWHCVSQQGCDLLGHHQLPELIQPTPIVRRQEFPRDEELDEARMNHQRILQCVAAEGSAVLVPPKSIRMITERPVNPLEECLLVVPIKIDDQFEMLLEVIQPASGGPAAQRGYLRFVAQMADLMSDYLRRARLREYSQKANYVQRLQTSLLTLSSAASAKESYQVAAAALAELLGAELVLLATHRRWLGWSRGWRVDAISHVPTFDSRSEIVMSTERLIATQMGLEKPVHQFTIVDTAELTREESTSDGELPGRADRAAQLRLHLNCHHLAQLPLGSDCHAILAFDSSIDLQVVRQRANELAAAFEALLACRQSSGSSKRIGSSPSAKSHAKRVWSVRGAVERWGARTAIGLLVLGVAFFPAPDNIATLAVLESADKELYYAPASATIAKVYVDTHQSIKKDEPLIQLVDNQLQTRIEELRGQKLSTKSQLQYYREELKRGGQSRGEGFGLYGRIDQLDIDLKAIEVQLQIFESQLAQLNVKARRDAIVTTWDAKNQLNGRPVSAGQLLLATYQPSAPWQLRVSIPERQLGRLREAMAGAREGLPVQFSISSHPSEVRQGRLVKLSDQLVKDNEGVGSAVGIVAVDSHSLPTKSDGAVARATIACGKTFAGWLAVRDAYRQASAWWRLNW